MDKFRVGDRVRVHYSSIHPSKNLYELRGYGNDEPAVVSKIDKDDSLLKYFVKFDKPLNSSDLRLWVSEDELEPLAPAVRYGGEIEPERKADPRVRYAVVVGDEIARWYNTFDEAAASAALHAMRTNKQTQVVKVVAIVKPGKPEVIRMEE